MAVFGLTLVAAVSLNSAKALAATATWDGGGSDNNFSTAANWDNSDTLPVDGDVLVFPSTVGSGTTRTLNNDMTGLSVGGVQITGTYSNSSGSIDFYTISGNDLTVTGNLTSTSSLSKLNLDITLGANISTSMYQIVPSGHTLTIGTHTLTTSGTGYVYGSIVGSGAVTANSWLSFGSAQTSYTGTLTQSASTLSLSSCSYLNNAAGIHMGADAQLSIWCTAGGSVTVPITLNGNGRDPQVQTGEYATTFYYPSIWVGGNLSSNITVTISSIILNADATYGSDISADSTVSVLAITKNGHNLTRVPGSSGALTVAGVGVVGDYNPITDSYNGVDSYEGTITDKMLYYVTGNQPGSNYTVKKGGIFGGSGTVGTIDIEQGAMLAPGMSPGCLNSGNVTFSQGGTYQAQLGGTTACTQYDQQRVNGTVTLGNATLSTPLWNNYKPAAGSTYTIISNDGADAVVGTFNNLPEGATYTQDGYVIQVSYKGGDGNDVVLTVKSVPKAPNTGFAPLTNNPLVTLVTSVGVSAIIALIAVRRKKLAFRTTQK